LIESSTNLLLQTNSLLFKIAQGRYNPLRIRIVTLYIPARLWILARWDPSFRFARKMPPRWSLGLLPPLLYGRKSCSELRELPRTLPLAALWYCVFIFDVVLCCVVLESN